MDDFLEGNFNEDCNELDNSNDDEAEAALYSMVHHSEDTYNPNMLDKSENYISQRNKADRWETIRKITDSVKPGSYKSLSQDINQAFDHIPLSNTSSANTSGAMYGMQYNERGQWLQYTWNYHGNAKPWFVQDRMRNNFYMNNNIPPLHIDREQIGLQNCVDGQEVLKISNFSSFENPRCNFRNEFHNTKDGEGFEAPVTSVESTPKQTSPSNNKKKKKSMADRRNNPFYPKELAHTVVTNMIQSKSAGSVKCVTVAAGGQSNILPIENGLSSSNYPENKVIDITKQNSTTEVITVCDTDGNDSDNSIVEVTILPKPEPPVIALDSSEERESSNVSNAHLVMNISGSGNKSADLSVELPSTSESTPMCSKHLKNSIFSVSSTSKKIKKRKRKKQKRAKSVECTNWTTGMIQFYNQSWGGETYDHKTLQQDMTSNPTKWKILDADRYGPVRNYGPLARTRCTNCHQLGHLVKHCPDPMKIICCKMCGVRGHITHNCPNKLCLQCGRPALMFNKGCPSCWKKDHPKKCTACGSEDHYKWLCPDVWRKLHSVTTSEDLHHGVISETQFKSSVELACCYCTKRGHVAAMCPSRPKHNYINNISQSEARRSPVDVFATFNILNKKRKMNRRSFIEGRNNHHEFNRKRRKTS